MVNTVEFVDERGDMERLARQYSDGGNVSRFVRNLIWDYHMQQQKENSVVVRQNVFQTIMFLFLAITLIIFGLSQWFVVEIITIVNVALLLFSGIIILIYVLSNYIILKKKKNLEVDRR